MTRWTVTVTPTVDNPTDYGPCKLIDHAPDEFSAEYAVEASSARAAAQLIVDHACDDIDLGRLICVEGGHGEPRFYRWYDDTERVAYEEQ